MRRWKRWGKWAAGADCGAVWGRAAAAAAGVGDEEIDVVRMSWVYWQRRGERPCKKEKKTNDLEDVTGQWPEKESWSVRAKREV